MAAATERTVCSGESEGPISPSNVSKSWGLTAITISPAPETASSLESVASIPWRSRSSVARSSRRAVATISAGSRQPVDSSPPRSDSPIFPQPRMAIRRASTVMRWSLGGAGGSILVPALPSKRLLDLIETYRDSKDDASPDRTADCGGHDDKESKQQIKCAGHGEVGNAVQSKRLRSPPPRDVFADPEEQDRYHDRNELCPFVVNQNCIQNENADVANSEDDENNRTGRRVGSDSPFSKPGETRGHVLILGCCG